MTSKVIKFLFALLLLAQFGGSLLFSQRLTTHDQRGGGSRSSGSSAGRGGGFSSSSSSSSSSRPSYTPSYRPTTTYISTSPGYKYGPTYYSSTPTTTCGPVCGIVIGSIFGGIALIVIIVCLVMYCRNRAVQSAPPPNAYYQPSNQIAANNPGFNPIQSVTTFQNRFNIVDSQSMTVEEFEGKRFALEFALNQQQYKFFYFVGGNGSQITIQDVKMAKERDFLYSLSLKAVDEVGSWFAEGYFLVSNRKIKLWFLKTYDNRELAGQTGQFSWLLYQSDQEMNNSYRGRWYYDKFEGSPDYSGTWTLELPQMKNIQNDGVNPYGNII